MKSVYTEVALVEAVRQGAGLGSMTHEEWCEGARHIEEHIRERLRSWYALHLRSAPAGRVPVRDLKESVREAVLTPGGALRVRLPRTGSRLVAVKLPEWERPVRRFFAPGSPAERRQADPWRRSTTATPAVILHEEDTIDIYGLATPQTGAQERVAPDLATRLENLMMTAWPQDGSYEFDDSDFPYHIIQDLAQGLTT